MPFGRRGRRETGEKDGEKCGKKCGELARARRNLRRLEISSTDAIERAFSLPSRHVATQQCEAVEPGALVACRILGCICLRVPTFALSFQGPL